MKNNLKKKLKSWKSWKKTQKKKKKKKRKMENKLKITLKNIRHKF